MSYYGSIAAGEIAYEREQKKLAQKGNIDAMYRLGTSGYGGSDYGTEDLMHWVFKAARHGHVRAQLLIARNYYYGKEDIDAEFCLSKNLKKAGQWFERAAKRGCLISRSYIIDIKGFEHNLVLAERGDVCAMLVVGKYYLSGLGADLNINEGMRWLKKVAKDGFAKAQHYLGMKLDDCEQKIKWLKEAAKQGHTESMYELGNIYHLGLGIKRDYKLAHKWYLLAAKQEHEQALERLRYKCFVLEERHIISINRSNKDGGS